VRLLLAALTAAALPAYGHAQTLGTIDLPEVSGLAPASTGPTLFVEQDSGNGPYVQRLDRRGHVLATYRLDARNHDWEDLAAAPDAQGRPSLFLADTGDNDAVRAEVQVLRVAEPAPGARRAGPVTTYRFRYADGPHDAEALLVLPGARSVAVVTKTVGTAGLYTAPLRAGAPQVLRKVAEVPLSLSGTPGGPVAPFGQLLVTGGAVSADGTRLALRTYTDLYEWRLDADLATVLARPGRRSPLPPSRQGEAVAYERDGSAVLVATEGRGGALQRLVRQAPPAARTPTPTPVAASQPAPRRPARGGGAVALLGGALLAGAGLVVVLRRRSTGVAHRS
jgi:hypothetical protein